METYTKWLANQKYIAGNEEQKIFKYHQAIQLYSDAIELNDELPQYYGYRGFARFNQLDLNLALQDAQKATLLDESYIDGHLLTIKCSIALGDVASATEAIETLTKLDVTAQVELAPEREQLNKLKRFLNDYKIKFDKKDYDGCLSVMAEAIKLFPGALHFQLRRAECMLWMKSATEAMNIAQTVISLDGSSAEAHYTLGLIYFHRDMPDEALKSLECSLKNDKEYKKAKILQELIKQIQADRLQTNKYFKNGKYKEALEVYLHILELDIQDNDEVTSKMWYNCALMNSKLLNLEEAIDNCDAALQRNPKYYKALCKRAECQFKLKNYDNCLRDCIEAYKIEMTPEVKNLFNEALKHSSNSLVNDPGTDEFIKVWNERYQNGLYTEAIDVCSEAITLTPMNIKFYEYRIECSIESGNYQMALKDLATLTLIENNNESRKLTKLRCLIFNGDLHKANSLLQDCFEADNQFKKEYLILDVPFCTALKVFEYFNNKNYNTCLEFLRTLWKAFDMKPLSTLYKFIKAECLFNTGHYKDSMVILDQVLQADPSNSKALYLKGLIFYETKELLEAITQFAKCLEFNSEIVDAQMMLQKTKEVKAKVDLGVLLLEANYYEHAYKVFDELLATLGSNVKHLRSFVLHQQAQCVFARGKYDICIENCVQILEMTESIRVQTNFTPKVETLLDSASEEWLKTRKTVIQDIRIRGDEKWKIEEGLKYLDTSNYKKACECFSEAIELYSDNPQSYVFRAECNMHLKLYDSAIANAECATKIDPYYLKGYLLTAKCCMILGDIFKTAVTLERIQKLSIVDPVIETISKDQRTLEAAVRGASKYFNSLNYRNCLEEIETALKIAHASNYFQLIKAECLVLLGEYDEAQFIIKSLTPSNDKDYINGLICYMKNDLLNASQYLDRCIGKEPGHKSAKRLLSNLKSIKTRIDSGNELMKMERFEDALNIFTEAMVVDKRNVFVNSELHLRCAECNYYMGNLKECLNDCNSALKLVPGSQGAIELQELCKTEPARIEREKEIANEAARQIRIGDDYRNKANWEQARTSYTRAISLKSDNASYYAKRAECNYKLGSLNECSSDCDMALNLVPECQEATNWRDLCETEIARIEREKKIANEAARHIRTGDDFRNEANWEQARTFYSRAISLKSDNASYYAKRAECNYKLGSLNECSSDCDMALNLVPECQEAITWRDLCKTEIVRSERWKRIANEAAKHISHGDGFKNKSNYEEAMASYTRAINLKPDNAMYYAKRAECHLLLGKFDSTLEDARKSTELDESFINGYIWEAKCLILLGKTECQKLFFEKLEQIQITVTINNDQKKEIIALRRVCKFFIDATESFKNKEYKQAIRHLDSAFNNFPNYNSMHYKLMKTECLIRLFRFNEAFQNIQQMECTNSHHLLFLKGLWYYFNDDYKKAVENFTFYKHQNKIQLNADVETLLEISERTLVVLNQSTRNTDSKELLKTLNSQITKYKYKKDLISAESCMKLYYQRALVNKTLGKNNKAILDCSEAINRNPNYVNALKLRQKLLDLECLFQDSIFDCETLLSIEENDDTRREYEKLKKISTANNGK